MSEDLRQEFPWRIAFMGVDTTATITAAFVGVIIARGQFARAIQPTLGSTIMEGAGELLPDADFTAWLTNGGPGTAAVTRVTYLCIPRGGSRDAYDWLTFSQAIERLGGLGLEEGADYFLHSFGTGTPIPPGGMGRSGLEVLSYRARFLEEVDDFDVRVEVNDISGDSHEKIMGCVYWAVTTSKKGRLIRSNSGPGSGLS
jgi:hypothetical protein